MSNILLVSATKLEHHDEELFGIPIHIVGIGKVESALNTYKLIQKYKPDHVVNFGSCGNLGKSKVGEVIRVGEVHDDFDGCVVPQHPTLYILPRSRMSGYKLFSTDTFYKKDASYSEHYTKKIEECHIVDMEGYSIANVCLSNNVDVSIYKWISDDGDSSDWLSNASIGYSNFKEIFKEQWL